LVLPLAFFGVVTGCSDSDSPGAPGASGADAGADTLLTVDGETVTGFDANEGDGDTCSAQTQQAVLVPVDMYIMMDSSGSMAEFAANTQTMKWEAISTALGDFLGSVTSSDMNVGIQFFPMRDNPLPQTCPNKTECGTDGACLDQPLGDRLCFERCLTAANCGNSECIEVSKIDKVCSNVTCAIASYTAPVVELAPLPGVAAPIIAAMKQQRPEGGTPTVPALKGAIAHASQWAAQHPERKPVVVFATDGLPTLCPFATDGTPGQQQNLEQAKQVAAEALAASPSVMTFVIGVVKAGEAQSNLNAIAAAGGSKAAFMVEPNQDTVAQFRAALEKIRGAMECEFKLPEVDAGTLNYMRVNVVFKAGAGASATLDYVGEASKCGAQGGWYYDVDPEKDVPSRILLCPATCQTAQDDQYSKIDIAIGCRTQVPGPK
jgi:hypothetical protein